MSTFDPNEAWWIVYLVMVEKDTWIPFLYTGSATNFKLGSKSRMSVYRKTKMSQLPSFLKLAIQDEFQITDMRVLA
jgi:hypothetical protein